MMKNNDVTYEYRVFTHRPIDIETMEVGRCTSKAIKELKPKDKIEGRFFHTSDTDEWFFCWGGKLQKLNLKGDADVNAALEEVNRLIDEANVAVEDAKKTAGEAKDAATAATAAVESINNKADKSYVNELVANEVAVKADKTAVEDLATTVAGKADASDVNDLYTTVDSKADKSELDKKADKSVVEDLVSDVATKADAGIVNDLSQVVATKADADDVQALSDKVNAIKLDDYATKSFVGDEIAKINIPTVPKNVSEFTNDAEYLNKSEADKLYAPIGSASDGSGSYATQDFVRDEIAKINIPTNVSAFTNDAGYLTEQHISGKQDAISDLEIIRSGAAAGATALQPGALDGYVTSGDVYTKAEIDALIGVAKSYITDTILA